MDYTNVDLLSREVHTYKPEPFYRWLLDHAPLYWDSINELWAVSRYEDVVFVSRNPQIFCSGHGSVPKIDLDTWPDEAMINLDGDPHTKQRALVMKGFTPGRISQWEDRARSVVTKLIDDILAKNGEPFDVVADLAAPLPMRMIGEMLGYPPERDKEVLEWTDIYVHGGDGPQYITEEVVESFANFCEFHEELMSQVRACPHVGNQDLLTLWLNAEIDGHKLTEEKIMFEHNLLLVGGSETTRNAISGGLYHLLRDPEQWQWLRDHPEGIDNAVEEIVRYICPFVRMRRTLTRDYEMHGRMMKEGDEIIMLYPAANRDPRVFEDPERFDVRRKFQKAKGPLSFGFGKHYCLGAALARLEIRVALEEILTRLPALSAVEDREVGLRESSFVRGIGSFYARA